MFGLHLMFYWDAFWELSTDRSEMGPIPFTAIDCFCKRHKIFDSDEFDSFCYFIRGLDSEYMGIKQRETEAKRNINNSKNKAKRKK